MINQTDGANTQNTENFSISSYVEPFYANEVQSITIFRDIQDVSSSVFGIIPVFNLELKFLGLTEKWQSQSSYLSSPDAIADLPAYREIIDLGYSVIPFIIKMLHKKTDFWFMALQEITGINPVQEEDRGNIERMAESWINWGRTAGLL